MIIGINKSNVYGVNTMNFYILILVISSTQIVTF